MHSKDFGIVLDGSSSVDFAISQSRKQKIVDGLVKGITGLMKSRKVTVFEGIATLGADKNVTVTAADGTSQVIQGANVALAPGSVPRMIPGFDRGGPIMSSDEVLDLDYIPARMAVIGGGAIGCEFASTFADLGSAGGFCGDEATSARQRQPWILSPTFGAHVRSQS